MTVTDRYVIREMNEKLVLKTIIQKETISRAEISKQTNLNKATVSSIVNSLLAKNLILELGMGESNGGRKPIMVTFNEKAGVSLSIDLGPDYISFIISYLNGEIISEKTKKLTTTDLLSSLKLLIERQKQKLPETTYGLIGICIGMHGMVNENKLIFSPFYSFDGIDLAVELEKHFQVPVQLENEANLSALGEKKYAAHSKHLISLSVRHGVGAGIILNEELFTGINGLAGEVGHLIVVPDGRPCPCGNKGCLEQYASEAQILRQYAKRLNQPTATFMQFKKDYLQDKPEALEMMDIFIKYLAIGVNNIIQSFNPEVIVINSRLTNQISGIIEQIKDQLSYKLNDDIQVKPSTLNTKASLLGGAYVNSVQFLEIQH